MSMLQFINTPFPDNHNGFDYAPKSFMEQQAELEASSAKADRAKAQKNMSNMLASLLK